MATKTQIQRAWLYALFSVAVLWGLSNVSMAFSSKVLGANGVIYTCMMFLSSAWVMLAYAGPGKLSKETLRSFDTWGYGVTLVLSFLTSFALFSIVTGAEASLLQRFSIVAGALTSWYFLARPLTKQHLIGMALILGGIVWIASNLPSALQAQTYTLTLAFGVVYAGRIFIAELHKPHTQAMQQPKDTKSRCRVIGYVMFVVSIMFLCLSLVLALIHYKTGQVIMPGLPTLNDFTNPAAILFGLVVGVVIFAPNRLIEFYTSHQIKTENYLALGAISPFATFFWEWATSPLTGLSLANFTLQDFIAGLIITAGGLLMALKGATSKAHNSSWTKLIAPHPQNPTAVQESRDILATTLSFTGGDLNRAAELLNLPAGALNLLLTDTNKIYAFTPNTLTQITHSFHQNISNKDALTGLINRSSFMAKLNNAISQNTPFSLFYLDLDKFKPINDTYGHQAGDDVLKIIAQRLCSTLPQATICRLGGDEFIILAPIKANTAQNVSLMLQQRVASPIKTEFVSSLLHLSASIGISHFPSSATTAEQLMALADQNMYRHKPNTKR